MILVFGYLIWGWAFIPVSGLRMTPGELFRSVLMAVCVACISYFAMLPAARQAGILIQAGGLKNYIHNAVYIVNEEIILGSMMLYFLTSRFKIKPLTASLILAVAVSIAHFVLYKWYFRDKGNLHLITLITLVLTVFAKNNLIIRYRHIGYAWALHFGWMVVMYGSGHFHASSHQAVTDLDRFNLYLGSPGILLASLTLAAGSLLYFPAVKKKIYPLGNAFISLFK
jgi:hypothetical protein